MIKKIKLETSDATLLSGAAYESRGDFVFLLQLLRNYDRNNDTAINNLYTELLKKIIKEQLIILGISKKYAPLDELIYKKTFDSNSGQMIYEKKYDIEILNLYPYNFDSFIQLFPYQYIEVNKLNKTLNHKNKDKIQEILSDIYNSNDQLKKMLRIIEKQYKTDSDSKLFFDMLDNIILEFRVIGKSNEQIKSTN